LEAALKAKVGSSYAQIKMMLLRILLLSKIRGIDFGAEHGATTGGARIVIRSNGKVAASYQPLERIIDC